MPVELQPFELYEVDAIFLNSEFAKDFVIGGQGFEVPANNSPMGHGTMLHWKDDWESGAERVGDGRHLFRTI